jgi:signal transduction histidine kinase
MIMPEQPPSLNRTQALELIDSLPIPLVVADNGLTVTFLNAAARALLPAPVQPPPVNLDEFLTANALVSEPLPPLEAELRVFRIQPAPQTSHQTLLAQMDSGFAAAALESLPVALILLDPDLRIADLNPAAEILLGRNALSVRRQALSWLLPEVEVSIPPENKETPQLQVVNTQARRLAVQSLSRGALTVLMLLDLTPFQTREFERAGLLRMIVHDLLNPLNIALNFAELLDGNLLDEAERRESAQIISRQLHRMNSLLADLALLDQMSEEHADLFANVSFGILAASVVSDLQPRATQGSIDLRIIALPETACIVRGNERLIQQALHNLVENAIKYTPPGGWVRVSLHERPPWVDAIVADSGIGIHPANQEFLYRPFYRVKDSRMAEVEGTGLGLSLVRMVVERHAGRIAFFSAPDRGTLFRLRLPQAESEQNGASLKTAANHSKST